MSLPHQLNQASPERISKDEYKTLISLGRGQPLPNAERVPIHNLVTDVALKKPNNIAVCSGSKTITYSELDKLANQIAQKLKHNGIGRGNRIGILIGPSLEMIAAVLGVLKCGAAYVPLDISQPDTRIKGILSNASVSGIIVDDLCIEKVKNLGFITHNIGSLIEQNLENHFLQAPTVYVDSTDPAYLIYTSGSTGEPKGVLIGHKQLFDSTLARQIVYPGSAVFLLTSPLACDSSVAGLWGTLTTGGKLVLPSFEEVRDPLMLIELIEKNAITHLLCVPSLYEALLEIAKREAKSRISSLNTVIVAGEKLHQSLVNQHFDFHGNSVVLFNEYGPTETTVWATYCKFETPSPVSIGIPVPGIQLYVLDENLQLIPQGKKGELFISGPQVAEGYFSRPEATEKVFIPDPFTNKANVYMYRTGDIVRWNNKGLLEFIGRRDHQIKIRGYRVELGAIENVLRKLDSIRDAAVVFNNENASLTAFIVARSPTPLKTLRKQLACELPPHMIPSKFFILKEFPKTISGKIDRAKLSLQTSETFVDKEAEETICPANSNKDQNIERVSAAWSEILNMPSVPKDVNFFDLGGHSLMIFRLQDALSRHTGKRPPIVSLFRHTTVSAQANMIFDSGLSIDDNSATAYTSNSIEECPFRSKNEK